MDKVLVIDDDLLFREMILIALEEAGYGTIEAESGKDGIEKARLEQPSLVICDVRMDGVDGYEVLAELRSDSLTAAVPVILMTGMADQDGMREGMNLGADDYLSKPFSVENLLQAVRTRIQKRQVVQQQIEQKLHELRASITLALPHELRTPLNGIITSAQLLELDGPQMTPDEIREFAGMIRTSGRRLQRMVENFLIYAQLEVLARDEQQIAVIRTNRSLGPDVLIQNHAQTRADEYERRGDLQFDLENEPIAISDAYLGKIVTELVDNALKFSEASTTVRIYARIVRDGYDLIIEDQGIGMEAERIEDIGAYMQFGRAIQEQQGTGLGLQIVRSLVTLHGGSIDIQSDPGRGTRVRCRLPRAAHTPQAEPPALRPNRNFETKT